MTHTLPVILFSKYAYNKQPIRVTLYSYSVNLGVGGKIIGTSRSVCKMLRPFPCGLEILEDCIFETLEQLLNFFIPDIPQDISSAGSWVHTSLDGYLREGIPVITIDPTRPVPPYRTTTNETIRAKKIIYSVNAKKCILTGPMSAQQVHSLLRGNSCTTVKKVKPTTKSPPKSEPLPDSSWGNPEAPVFVPKESAKPLLRQKVSSSSVKVSPVHPKKLLLTQRAKVEEENTADRSILPVNESNEKTLKRKRAMVAENVPAEETKKKKLKKKPTKKQYDSDYSSEEDESKEERRERKRRQRDERNNPENWNSDEEPDSPDEEDYTSEEFLQKWKALQGIKEINIKAFPYQRWNEETFSHFFRRDFRSQTLDDEPTLVRIKANRKNDMPAVDYLCEFKDFYSEGTVCAWVPRGYLFENPAYKNIALAYEEINGYDGKTVIFDPVTGTGREIENPRVVEAREKAKKTLPQYRGLLITYHRGMNIKF